MQKLAKLISNKPFVYSLWFGLSLFLVIKGVLAHQGFNNYTIFKYNFLNTIHQHNLYAYQPEHYYDLNHYGPIFSIIMAPFSILPDSVGVILWVLFRELPGAVEQRAGILGEGHAPDIGGSPRIETPSGGSLVRRAIRRAAAQHEAAVAIAALDETLLVDLQPHARMAERGAAGNAGRTVAADAGGIGEHGFGRLDHAALIIALPRAGKSRLASPPHAGFTPARSGR